MNIEEQINIVVEAREKAREANASRIASYNKWVEENQVLFKEETETKLACSKVEGELKELALETYAETKDKTVAPGIGIRVMTKLSYETTEAMDWAIKHTLALRLETSVFEKLAKLNHLSFVSITKEPSATISTELEKVSL